MRRVEADELWSLIDPDAGAATWPTCGARSSTPAYREAEAEGRYVRQVPARELYGRMMRTLAQTGNGWMTFKDAANRAVQPDRRARQRRAPVQPVHRDHRGHQRRRDRRVQPRLDQPRPRTSTAAGATAIDWERLRATVRTAVPFLDRVIDINYYPTEQAAASNPRWRPVGLGVMGLQDVFFALRPAVRLRRGPRAVHPDRRGDLPRPRWRPRPSWPRRHGPHPAFAETRAAARAAAARPVGRRRRRRPSAGRRCGSGSPSHGLRNSLLIAIAPTATIASIAGLLRVHRAAGVEPVQARDAVGRVPADQHRPGRASSRRAGCGRTPIRDAIKRAEGSVQGIAGAARRASGRSSARRGSCRSGADRPGRGARRRSSTRASR